MHITGDYYPIQESKLPQWHQTFVREFTRFAEKLGFDATEIEAAQRRSEMVSYVVVSYKPDIERAKVIAFELAAQVLGQGEKLDENRNLHPYPLQAEPPVWVFGIEKSTRALVAQIKSRPAYTPEIGAVMGIVGPRHVRELSAPQLQLSALPNRRVRVKWKKFHASALELLIDSNPAPGPQQSAAIFLESRIITPAIFEISIAGEGAQAVQIAAFYLLKGERIGEIGPQYTLTLQP